MSDAHITIFSSHTLTYSHTKHTYLKTHTHTPQPEYDPSTEGHRQRGRELHNQQEVEREGKPTERRTLLEVAVLSSQQGERGRGRDRRKRAVRKGSRDLGGVGRPWVCVCVGLFLKIFLLDLSLSSCVLRSLSLFSLSMAFFSLSLRSFRESSKPNLSKLVKNQFYSTQAYFSLRSFVHFKEVHLKTSLQKPFS